MFTLDRVEFAGYGLDVPAINHMDFRGRDVKGAAVIYLGPNGPRGFDAEVYRTLLAYRDRYVTDGLQASALIGPQRTSSPVSPGANASGAGRGAARLVPDFTTTTPARSPRGAHDYRRRRVLHVSLQPGARALRRAEAPRRRAGRAAVLHAQGRDDHVQRGRGLSGRPHAADPERRRHRGGQRSAVEVHVRGVRRALRSRRLRRGADDAERSDVAAVCRTRQPELARRPHLEWRRRRRIGHRRGDGAGACLRQRSAAEAVLAVRLARRRGAWYLRVALLRRSSDRAPRSHRCTTQHRHDRPEPQR